MRTRATRMLGIVAELLFVSNAAEAAVLANEAVPANGSGRDAVAAVVAVAIVEFQAGKRAAHRIALTGPGGRA